jgi:hypothetical protein
MAYTSLELITNAYYASGIVSREFETVSGSQTTSGLDWLNDLLLESVADVGMIPYSTTSTFTGSESEENYTIPGLINIDTLTFVKDTVRYPMTYIGRDQYTGQGRALNIDSLPYQYNYERILNGSRISMYFRPDQAYVFTIVGTFALTVVTLHQDLELTLDNFYRTYLRYALADRICVEFSMPVPKGVTDALNKYISIINKSSRPLDLKLRKQSTLQSGGVGIYGWANLGRGYTP